MDGVDPFRGSSMCYLLETKFSDQVPEAFFGEPMKDTRRTVFMPGFPKSSCGPALSVPGLDQPITALFGDLGSNFMGFSRIDEVWNHLNHT